MKKLIVITGPTATGKSKMAIELAGKFNGEIISADSAQVYKGMDIGTAKVLPEERQGITHHLLDVADIKEPFSAAVYQKMAREAIEDIIKRGKTPFIVGGTGLYIRAAIDNLNFPSGKIDDKIRKELEDEMKKRGIGCLYEELIRVDPGAQKYIDRQNTRRVIRALEVYRVTGKPFTEYRKDRENWESVYPAIIIGLKLPRQLLYERINARVEDMFAKGLIEETAALVDKSLKDAIVSKQAIGYKEVIDYMEGRVNEGGLYVSIKQRTRNLAKRQMTWFRKDPRIKWVDVAIYARALKEAEEIISRELA